MRTIERKKLLYKSKVEYTSGEGIYAMNHVLGCPHGCKYPCYAYLTAKRFGQVESYEDWCDPKLVENTLELLDHELLAKRKEPISRVHLCFTTDPFPWTRQWDTEWLLGPDYELYQQLRKISILSLAAIDKINKLGIPVTVLTKGELPEPIVETYTEKHRRIMLAVPPNSGDLLVVQDPHPDNEYGISLVSLDEGFRERWEPNTAPYAERIRSLEALHDAGCRTWVSMEPFPALSAAAASVWGAEDMRAYYAKAWAAIVAIAADVPGAYPEYAGHDAQLFGGLVSCLNAVRFTDRIVFGRWNHNDSMPTDVEDIDAWYGEAAQIVASFCERNGIECIIKSGTKTGT